MQLSIYEWIQFAVIFLTVAGVGLAHLKNQSFVVKSTAWSNIVAGAINIVAQIEETLKGDNAQTSRATLIAQGVAELKQVYEDSLAAVKLPGGLVDNVLTLLFQRLIARLPTDLSGVITEVITPPAALAAAGAKPIVKTARKFPLDFLRPLGPVKT